MTMKAKDLLTRTLSGALYVLIILVAIYFPPYGVMALAILFGISGLLEFQKITIPGDENCTATKIADIALMLAIVMIAIDPLAGGVCALGIFMIRLIEQLYILHDNPIRHLGISLFSALYLGLPMACMVTLGCAMPWTVILCLFLMIWINDTGAFLVGCTFGRHRLFERISPKKSWEGFFGGIAFNIVFALIAIAKYGLMGEALANVPAALGLVVVVTIFATYGDLVESMIKRTLHIKDSGNLIPGHGGLLDRIDSLLFVLPAALVYLLLLAA